MDSDKDVVLEFPISQYIAYRYRYFSMACLSNHWVGFLCLVRHGTIFFSPP